MIPIINWCLIGSVVIFVVGAIWGWCTYENSYGAHVDDLPARMATYSAGAFIVLLAVRIIFF